MESFGIVLPKFSQLLDVAFEDTYFNLQILLVKFWPTKIAFRFNNIFIVKLVETLACLQVIPK